MLTLMPVMRKIVNYKILSGHTQSPLDTQVAKHITDGWEPYGNPLQSQSHVHQFAQALVKYEDVPPSADVKEMHYLSESEMADLHASVSRHLKEGWKPFGSLVVDTHDGRTSFYQAMIK
jgi:hypothetical protein